MAGELLPEYLPSLTPKLMGPALSFSQVHKVTDASAALLDTLEQKIRASIAAGLADAAREGIRLETKVTNHLAKALAPPEQLVNDITSLVQNHIAGELAQAVTLAEDLTGESGASAGVINQPVAAHVPRAGAVASPAPPTLIQPARPSSVTRATTLPGVGPAFFGPLLGENNPGLNPPGPCPMIDEATWKTLQKGAQTIADQACAAGSPPGEAYVGNWWHCTEDCCVIGPMRAPNDIAGPAVAKYFDFAVDGFPSCAAKGFAWFLTQWNPKGLACGSEIKPPVDCKAKPLDPSCPPDCFVHPEDPRCPPGTCPPPCIQVTCPPPVINIPPCPPLNLPSCIQIDLCDWKKFCDALTNCIGAAKEDCALDNDTAYTFKDCDGTYGQAQHDWLGMSGDALLQPATLDDMATAGQALSQGILPIEYGLDQPY